MRQTVNPVIDIAHDETALPGNSSGAHENGLWLITFSDLMSLMFAFFVMLFAMSSIQTEAWKSMVTGLSDELSPGREISILKKEEHSRPNRLLEPKGIDLHYLEAVLTEKFRNHPVLSGARIRQGDGRLSVALPANLIFQAGEGQFEPGAQRIFEAVGQALSSIRNRIEIHVYVSGNARNALSGDRHSATAWELAIGRSLMIRKLMLQQANALPIIPVAHVIEKNSNKQEGELIELVIRELGGA